MTPVLGAPLRRFSSGPGPLATLEHGLRDYDGPSDKDENHAYAVHPAADLFV